MYPQSYIEFLYEFHYTRDYFECHEVLEDYWKDHTNMKRDSIWVGLIQLAVCLYHYRRNNVIGAKKLIDSSLEKLQSNREYVNKLGLSEPELFRIIYNIKNRIELGLPYDSVDLPIHDSRLQQQLETYATKKDPDATYAYHITSERIIHHHLKKYRTD